MEKDICKECGQFDLGQVGEYPCKNCGLPTLWDYDIDELTVVKHNFLDADIIRVVMTGQENNTVEIVLNKEDSSVLLSKEDIVALAKQFNLLLFEEASCL